MVTCTRVISRVSPTVVHCSARLNPHMMSSPRPSSSHTQITQEPLFLPSTSPLSPIPNNEDEDLSHFVTPRLARINTPPPNDIDPGDRDPSNDDGDSSHYPTSSSSSALGTTPVPSNGNNNFNRSLAKALGQLANSLDDWACSQLPPTPRTPRTKAREPDTFEEKVKGGGEESKRGYIRQLLELQ